MSAWASSPIVDAGAKQVVIARKNDEIANQFSTALLALVESGKTFETEVARFRV